MQKRVTILITLTFLLAISIFVNAQNFEWIKQIGGTSEKYSAAIAVDGSGNICVTGWFWGTVDFDPGPDTLNLTSNGGSDIFICKLNPQGNLIWVKQIGGSEVAQNDDFTDYGYSIVTDSLENIYISGGFWGKVDFDPGPDSVSLTSEGNSGNFICKFDALGNFLWARDYGENVSDYGAAPVTAAVDMENNVYLTGVSLHLVDSINDLNYENNIFAVKFDSSGNIIWENVWVNYFMDISASIFVDNAANVYITGSYYTRIDFDPGQGTFYLSDMDEEDTMPDAFILKLDSLGNFVWAKQIGGEGLQFGFSCNIDRNGNIYVLGLFLGDTDFDPGPDVYNFTKNGTGVSVVKFTEHGNLAWVKQIEGNGDIWPGSMVLDVQANIYITGFFGGSVDFDPNENIVNYDSFISDIFVTKWDSAGNFRWFNRLRNPDNLVNNTGVDLAIRDNEIFATGNFEGTLNVEMHSNEQTFTSQSERGKTDILIYKISQLATTNDSYNFERNVTFYPNPTTGKLNVELGKVYPELHVLVRNTLGQEVISEEFNDVNHFQLSLDGATSGMYFIHVTNKNEKRAVLKVLKQ